MFKKPARRGNIRKKRKLEEEEEEEEESTVDVLQGMRELQKMRGKAHGINPVTAEEREREAEKKRQQKEMEAQTKAEQQQGGLLNSFFEKTTEKSAIDKQMENYIERNMKVLKGEDPDAEDEKPKTAEDLLYRTPADLAPATSATRESELSGVSDIKVSNFAAHLQSSGRCCAQLLPSLDLPTTAYNLAQSWIRCMQEVELDIDTKLANIERTEKARITHEEERKLMRSKKAQPSVTLIPQNFNANFQEHKFDFQNRAVSTTYGGGRGGGGGGRGGGGRGGGRGAASDDSMVDRFKRSARGRGRGR